MTKILTIIVNYRTPELAEKCLEALALRHPYAADLHRFGLPLNGSAHALQYVGKGDVALYAA